MRACVVLKLCLAFWILASAPSVRAAEEYRFQAVGVEIQTLHKSEAGTVSLVSRVYAPAPIDSLLAVGSHLYVAYAKRYIALYDASRPTAPVLRTTLTAADSVARLRLGAEGKSTLLLVTTYGATAAYSLADPLQPEPLLGSPPLRPLTAEQEAEWLAIVEPLSGRRFRDYSRLHPMVGAGVALLVLGGLTVGSAVAAIKISEDDSGAILLLGISFAVTGSIHVLVGSGLIGGGMYRQESDRRPPRPKALVAFPHVPR